MSHCIHCPGMLCLAVRSTILAHSPSRMPKVEYESVGRWTRDKPCHGRTAETSIGNITTMENEKNQVIRTTAVTKYESLGLPYLTAVGETRRGGAVRRRTRMDCATLLPG